VARGNRTDNGNLKRGLIPQPHGGALRPRPPLQPGDADRLRAGQVAAEERRDAVRKDPDAALEAVHVQLTDWVVELTKRGKRRGESPDAGTIQVIRELRQTTEAVTELRRAKGAITQAKDFFEQLDDRVAAAVQLAGAPQPVVDPA
jgi:hypothetical protein